MKARIEVLLPNGETETVGGIRRMRSLIEFIMAATLLLGLMLCGVVVLYQLGLIR